MVLLKVSKIQAGKIIEFFVGDEKFVLKPVFSKEPVKLLENAGDVVWKGCGWTTGQLNSECIAIFLQFQAVEGSP